MNHCSVKHNIVMVNIITSHNTMNVVHIIVAVYIVDNYCLCLTEEWFILLWLEILLTITVLWLTEQGLYCCGW
jgi:hypothetical protein